MRLRGSSRGIYVQVYLRESCQNRATTRYMLYFYLSLPPPPPPHCLFLSLPRTAWYQSTLLPPSSNLALFLVSAPSLLAFFICACSRQKNFSSKIIQSNLKMFRQREYQHFKIVFLCNQKLFQHIFKAKLIEYSKLLFTWRRTEKKLLSMHWYLTFLILICYSILFYSINF